MKRHQFKPGGRPVVLAPDHEAITNSTTRFPSRIRSASQVNRVLIPAEMNAKIGGPVWMKGPRDWRGARMFTVSLVERETCYRGCEMFRSCFPNHLQHVIRIRPDEHLIPKLAAELAIHCSRFRGVSVRLHVSGDFPDPEYARAWIEFTQRWKNLTLFGFTRWPRTHEIGRVIDAASGPWDRIRIRFSFGRGPRSSTVITDREAQGLQPDGSIVCPAETQPQGAKDCSTCGLCLTTQRRIALIEH